MLLSIFGTDSTLESQASIVSPHITREALYYRFTKTAVRFLEMCLSWVLQRQFFSKSRLLDVAQLKFCNKLFVVDSTFFSLSPKLASALPGSGGDGSTGGCKLQTILELKQGQLHFCEITSATTPDQSYTSHLPEFLDAGDLILFDLGYFKVQTLNEISARGGFFLTRFLFGLNLQDASTGEPIDVLAFDSSTITDREIILATDKSKVKYRLIAVAATASVAEQRRRRLYEDVRRRTGKTPTKKRLEFCGWSLFLTNVSPCQLAAEKVMSFYSFRWQIEIFFKVLKSLLKITDIHTANESRLRCHILGKILFAALIYRFYGTVNSHCWNQYQLEISLHKLTKKFIRTASLLHSKIRKSLARAFDSLVQNCDAFLQCCIKRKQNSRKTTLHKISQPLPAIGFLCLT